jgi:hypothetical protein
MLFILSFILTLSIVGGLYLWFYPPALQQVSSKPLTIPLQVPIPNVLEAQVATLLAEEAQRLVNPTPTPVVAVVAVTPATSAVEITEATLTDEIPVDPAVTQDRKMLDKYYSEFAYVEYGGLFANKRMGIFHNNLNREQEKEIEGGTIHGLRLDGVEEQYVLLSYGKAGPVKKPRIDLNISNDPTVQLTEAEQQVRAVRYQELYGNLFRIASSEANGGVKPKPIKIPSPQEEQAARQHYMETYGVLFQKMQAGDPTMDPREIPNPDLNFDDTVKRYFETYWPGQVEYTTENAGPGGD